jgi:predicted RNA binding protein YcfA (HicA-like mRNA interferase family)
MAQFDKLLTRILSGRSDANIGFGDLCSLLGRLGFQVRIKGDHHIYYREGIAEIINIQPKSGKAKPYQVKQVRNLILKYKLGERHEEL